MIGPEWGSSTTFLLFFLSGLAYFAMGLTIILELRHNEFVPLRSSLRLLAAFAFVASLGNWLELFFHGGSGASSSGGSSLHTGSMAMLGLASVLLFQFGLRLLAWENNRFRYLQTLFGLVVVAFLAIVAFVLLGGGVSSGDRLAVVEFWIRLLLFFPGLLLSALGLWSQHSRLNRPELARVAHNLAGAALSFAVKAAASGLVAIPLHAFSWELPFPLVFALQLLRTLATVAITLFILGTLTASEVERQRQTEQAAREKLESQQKALAAEREVCDEIRAWSSSVSDIVQSISSAISQPLELEEVMYHVLRETLNLAGLQRGIAMLLDEEKQELYQVAHFGVPDWFHQALTTVRVGAGLAGWCAQHGEVLIVEDMANDPRPFVPRTIEVAQFYAGIPLKAEGKVLGIINLIHGEPHSLSAQQIALLTAAGQQLGVAIAAARLTTQLQSMAALEERARLSRELHDNLLQVVAYLHLKSQIAQRLLVQNNLVEAAAELKEIEISSSQAYDDVRDSIAGLRVTLPPGRSLVTALEDHVGQFQERSQMAVSLDVSAWDSLSLPRGTEVQLLRIVQEALTNVRRHARAKSVSVVLGSGEQMATISVRDDGIGFDPANTNRDGQHLGLQTMRERAEGAGARLQVRSAPGQGTEIWLELPLRR